MDTGTMRCVHTRTTILRVGERNEIMNHEDRVRVALCHRPVVARELHPVVTCMQQNCAIEFRRLKPV